MSRPGYAIINLDIFQYISGLCRHSLMVEHSHGKAAMRVRFSLSASLNIMTIVSPAGAPAGGAVVFIM